MVITSHLRQSYASYYLLGFLSFSNLRISSSFATRRTGIIITSLVYGYIWVLGVEDMGMGNGYGYLGMGIIIVMGTVPGMGVSIGWWKSSILRL